MTLDSVHFFAFICDFSIDFVGILRGPASLRVLELAFVIWLIDYSNLGVASNVNVWSANDQVAAGECWHLDLIHLVMIGQLDVSVELLEER